MLSTGAATDRITLIFDGAAEANDVPSDSAQHEISQDKNYKSCRIMLE